MSANGLLLDTCAVIYAALGHPIRDEARIAIEKAREDGRLFVSPVLAWEMGLMSRSGRTKALFTAAEARLLVVKTFSQPGITVAPLTAAILFASSHLPGDLHRDPADCLYVATARAYGLTLVTDDRKIITYAAEGHARVLEA